MAIGRVLGTAARKLDRRFGILAVLAGEPRPPAGGFDIKGEKLLDWGFICTGLPHGPKKALEIGSGESPILPAMLALGYDVTAVDLCADASKYLGGINFILGDFTRLDLNSGFDVIVACSTIEHIGLSGRYGSTEDPDGDLRAMAAIHRLLNPDGLVFLTVPVGRDTVVKPWHRVYGRERLPELLAGFDVMHSRFLVKKPWGPWNVATSDAALRFPVDERRYALGQMILRKGIDREKPRI